MMPPYIWLIHNVIALMGAVISFNIHPHQLYFKSWKINVLYMYMALAVTIYALVLIIIQTDK